MPTIAPGWQSSPLVFLAVAAVFALLLVLRSRGRVDRAWATLLAPGSWRWGLAASGLGLAACALLVAGALPALLGADCQAATGAQGLLRAVTILGIGFGAGGVLCLSARGMLASAAEGVRGAAWPAAGRVVGVSGLACLAFAWAMALSGLSALVQGGDGQTPRSAWAAQARETCRIAEASLAASAPPPAVAPAVQAPAPQPLPAQPSSNPAQERLLAEIRDLLRDQQRRAAQAATLPPIPPAYVPPRTDPSRTEPRPTARRPAPTRPVMPFYGYPYEY